jgi:hypothetical protein
MKTFVGIPVVNRFDLLERALNCIPEDINGVVANNSGKPLVVPGRFESILSPVPLSYSQSMNAFQHKAKYEIRDYWFFMHSDGVAKEADFRRLIEMAESASLTDKWACIFTHYDVLALFNTKAVADIGPWDHHSFPNYFTDNDWYRRARLKGYEMFNLPEHTVEHGENGNGSRTINSDPVLLKTNEVMFPAYRALYAAKWGGEPGHETYATPWNR